ncbi:hypothetical protein P8452_41205 [Trifolium repens]|nr:hypothetical protein P8452_41199 [Trifolium repens]WJX55434.1 hypothetical protein P8452_41202 [Trifolium repens]WJX55437.1 hypothetical protein P8452_41205 [Trifolium repens]
MADLFSGGAVGALIGELLKKTIQTIKNAGDFGSTLQTSIETVDALSPLLEKIKGTKDEDIVRLETHIREIKDLVEISKNLKRKRTWWKYLAFSTYQAKLQKKDLAFQRHLAVHGQMKMLVTVTQILEISMVVSADLKVVSADVKEVSADVKEVSADVKEVSADVKEVSADVKLILERLDGNQVRGCCGAPEEPQCMGMDELLTQLKVEMMSGGVLVRVLTGLGESGKTTLAKKLCSDPQIKGKFGGNIFFITVSATPNLKNIVQTQFEYCGLRVPEFHNDEDAINRLRFLLSQVGRNPILIVLDDVLPGSESLVEKFQFEMLKFQMQDCKILLTSRAVAFRRFGTHCQLYRLDQNHQHAVSLFAQLNHSSSYMPDKNLVHEVHSLQSN